MPRLVLPPSSSVKILTLRPSSSTTVSSLPAPRNFTLLSPLTANKKGCRFRHNVFELPHNTASERSRSIVPANPLPERMSNQDSDTPPVEPNTQGTCFHETRHLY